MRRTIAIIGVAFATIGGVYAGQVLPIDLSQTPVGVCTGSCTVSSTSTGTFENVTFATIFPTNPPSAPSSSAVNTSFGPTPFIINAPTTGGNAGESDYLSPTTSGNHSATLLIDLGTCTGAGTSNSGPGGTCGISDADAVYTMLNGGGVLGGSNQNITITVEGVNSADVYTTDIFTLLPGVDYRDYDSAVLGASCTVADSPNNTTDTSCVGAATGPTDTSSVSGTDPNNSNITVYNNVFGAQVSTNDYYIDTQALSLGSTFLNGGYVDSVLIQYNGPTGGNKQLQFSALSVDTVPEPSTWAMLGLGLGIIGFMGFRSQRAKKAVAAE